MIRIKRDWKPPSPVLLGQITPAAIDVEWTIFQSSVPYPFPQKVLVATRGCGEHPLHLDELREYLQPEAAAKRFATWKASLRISASSASDSFADARAHIDGGYPCSGIAASWCPNCGDCTCPRDEDGSPVTRVRETAFCSRTIVSSEVVHSESCPLHSPNSPHATGAVD